MEPLYTTCSPNVPLTLFEGDMQLLLESGRAVSAPGVIKWEWLPHCAIRFNLEGLDLFPHSADLSEAQLDIQKLGLSCKVSITGVGMSKEGAYCRGLLATPVVMGTGLECNQVVFHLPNFFKFVGEPIRNRNLMTWRGRLCLRSDKWKIVLDPVQILGELIKALNSQGGFALTHTGSLRRADGGEFSYGEADDLLEALYFLSFCRGFWCGPILAAVRLNDVNVWQEWTHTRLTPWKYVESWFPQHNVVNSVHEINQAFRGFMARWEDDLWKEPVKHSIHWYVESNIGAGGIEGAIVLTQTALELLGWLYLVEDPRTRSWQCNRFQRENESGRDNQAASIRFEDSC